MCCNDEFVARFIQLLATDEMLYRRITEAGRGMVTNVLLRLYDPGKKCAAMPVGSG
jgi:hypothetical protein